jgi:hypothetical protein
MIAQFLNIGTNLGTEKAPEIYGLAIKFWTYFNAFGQAPPQ